jgi:hypothetical protein
LSNPDPHPKPMATPHKFPSSEVCGIRKVVNTMSTTGTASVGSLYAVTGMEICGVESEDL